MDADGVGVVVGRAGHGGAATASSVLAGRRFKRCGLSPARAAGALLAVVPQEVSLAAARRGERERRERLCWEKVHECYTAWGFRPQA